MKYFLYICIVLLSTNLAAMRQDPRECNHVELFASGQVTHHGSCAFCAQMSPRKYSDQFPKPNVSVNYPVRSEAMPINSAPATTASSLNNSFSNSPLSYSASNSPKKDDKTETDLEQLRALLERLECKSPKTRRASVNLILTHAIKLNTADGN